MEVQFPYRNISYHKKQQPRYRGCFNARRMFIVFTALLFLYGGLSAFLYLYTQFKPDNSKMISSEKPPDLRAASMVSTPLVDAAKGPIENPDDVERRKEEEKRLQNQERSIDEMVNLSNKYKAEKNWAMALEILDKGLLLYPRSDKLATYKGGWHYDQGNWTGAEIWYRKAHEWNKGEVIYVMNIALCLVNQHKEAEAIGWYQLAYDMRPNAGQLLALFSLQWKFNNWSNYERNIDRILKDTREEIEKGHWVSINSFVALHLPFNLWEIQQIAASASKSTMESTKHWRMAPFHHDPVGRKLTGDRIRVGYVSYDFRQHAVGIQVQSMFGFHNRSKYEVWAYNVNDGKRDSYAGPVNDRIRKEVEHYVDLGSATLPEAAQRIYDDKIDVLIDVGLFTAYARTDIFCVRPAPIQVAWLGLATTTGASWMDYVVVDPVVVPHHSAKYYTEKLAVLPHSYHIVDHKQSYGIQEEPNRRSRGLPDNKFLFCNHANNIRLNPELFGHWYALLEKDSKVLLLRMNILKKSPNSTLVLKHFNDEATKNLKEEAIKRGIVVSDNIDQSQILFQHGIGGNEHIAYKSMCDLYLDMHWYNGHSTTADMLWAGVPLVTYPGDTMASRAAASFATSTGVPTERMIANSWEEYEEKAIDMAKNWKTTTNQLRAELRAKRMTMPFFDTRRWVGNLERSMEQMFLRYIEGKSPEHIYVIDNND